MSQEIDLQLSPEEAADEQLLRRAVASAAGLRENDSFTYARLRQSIDARQRNIKVLLKVKVFTDSAPASLISYKIPVHDVSGAPRVIIVGAGPAGLFAALQLIEAGVQPVILERGKDVRERRRDLAAINKAHVVNPESNYCFGEGGAGTYSDGKLYTRSVKRGDVRRILEIFNAFGAPENILYEAHPHIGTNKLPKIIEAMRRAVVECGGRVLFNEKVTELILTGSEVRGVRTASGGEYTGKGVILATGHSARDVYEMLHRQGILIEAKPFALGVRAEHPQSIVNRSLYRCDVHPLLPSAAYSLVHQAELKEGRRGVFSFCMCPGGFIVPAATAPGEVVVNGMSPSKRDSPYANSGIVVNVELSDYKAFAEFGPLAGVEFQKSVEGPACLAGGGTQTAPAQRLVDFVTGKLSGSLPDCSYQPGLKSAMLDQVLPPFVASALKEGFKAFGNKMNGYFTNDAVLLGVESRTSSPVRIPRIKETCEHPQIAGLYPCAEGAGYAGGIVSAAMDGERCARELIKKYITVNQF